MPTTIKVAFRGLLVFNEQRDATSGKKFMEIGFLDARDGGGPHGGHDADHSKVHIPRILTMENGLLASVVDLRNVDELGIVRNWQLKVNDPDPPEITLAMTGSTLDRTLTPTPDNKRDFRWITDFEGADLHARPLQSEIGTRNLLMVLTVRTGEFSTLMLSPFLKKKKSGEAETDYGHAAAVTGCNITFETGVGVSLLAGSTSIHTFVAKPDRETIFEISNSPVETLPDKPIKDPQSHFHMYYDKLFIKTPPDQFQFIAIGTSPGPDPTLCGPGFLSQFQDAL